MNTYAWLVKREFWENRAIWIVPVSIGAALTLAALFGRVHFDGMTAGEGISPGQINGFGGVALFAFGTVFFVVMSIYSSWYLLDCLYADRKDRSILFWKSLPVSDAATVGAKLFTGLIAIPVVYFIAADLSTLLMAFIISVRTPSAFAAALWQPGVWLQLQALWVYLILTTALWYLPFAGWFLAVSAWAKRAVLLWSVLPPVALLLLERWFLHTHVIATLIGRRALGYPAAAFHGQGTHGSLVSMNGDVPTTGNVWRLLDPVGFLTDPATWIGVVVGGAFIVAAIQLRLRRSEA